MDDELAVVVREATKVVVGANDVEVRDCPSANARAGRRRWEKPVALAEGLLLCRWNRLHRAQDKVDGCRAAN
jgi:hypothetical protein